MTHIEKMRLQAAMQALRGEAPAAVLPRAAQSDYLVTRCSARPLLQQSEDKTKKSSERRCLGVEGKRVVREGSCNARSKAFCSG